MLSPVTAQRSYGEPRAQTNARVRKLAAQKCYRCQRCCCSLICRFFSNKANILYLYQIQEKENVRMATRTARALPHTAAGGVTAGRHHNMDPAHLHHHLLPTSTDLLPTSTDLLLEIGFLIIMESDLPPSLEDLADLQNNRKEGFRKWK